MEQTLEELYAKKKANSEAWHTAATQEEKDALHKANVDIMGQIDAMTGSKSTYDGATGVWTSTRPTPSDDNSETIKKQYAAQWEAALAKFTSQKNQAISEYDAQAAKLPEQYRVARNNVAAQNAIAKKNFDEQAVANGLNSGASGQAALSRSAVYQANLAGLDRSQAADLAEIDRAKANIQAQYAAEIARAKAENDANMNNDLLQEMIRVQGLRREDEQIAYDRQLTERQYADALEAQSKTQQRSDVEDARARLDTYLSMGGTVGNIDPALVAASGYTPAELATKERYYAAQLAAGKTASSSGGSSKGGLVTERPLSMDYEGLFHAALDSGNPKSWLAQKANYAAYGFSSSSGLWDDYQAWEANQEVAKVENEKQKQRNAEIAKANARGELSTEASKILNTLRNVNPGTGVNVRAVFESRINEALAQGTISNYDAELLIDTLTGSSGMGAGTYSGLSQRLTAMLNSGNALEALNLFNNNLNAMSERQAEELEQLFARYGITMGG